MKNTPTHTIAILKGEFRKLVITDKPPAKTDIRPVNN
jgi:hypothetical protein